MTIFHFAVTLLKAFELGPALFWSSKEATLSQLLSHSPIQLALPMTGLQCFIKPSLMEDVKESLGLLVAPVHTCHSRINFKDTRVCSHSRVKFKDISCPQPSYITKYKKYRKTNPISWNYDMSGNKLCKKGEGLYKKIYNIILKDIKELERMERHYISG